MDQARPQMREQLRKVTARVRWVDLSSADIIKQRPCADCGQKQASGEVMELKRD